MRADSALQPVRFSDFSRGMLLLLIGVISTPATVNGQSMTDRLRRPSDARISGEPASSEKNKAESSLDSEETSGKTALDQDVRIGAATTQYMDPEFSSPQRQVVFQTHTGSVWVGDVDPQTGLLVSWSGKDYLLATGAAPLISTVQGPEFGRDSQGTSVYFTKISDFRLQLWRSRLENGMVTTEQITGGITPRRTVCPSANAESESVKLLYLRGPTSDFSWASADERTPDDEMIMPEIISGVSGPRWITGTTEFMYIVEVEGAREIARADAATGESRILTHDGGEKVDMFPFRAPEFDNDVLFLVNFGQTELGIYRDLGGDFYDRILTLTPPPHAEHSYMVSVEPFAAGGRTYLTMEMHRTPAFLLSHDSSIWVFDLNDDPETRLARRLDDGSVAHRIEAEWFIGSNEVFIYYSVIDLLGRWELHRTRTGIVPQNPAIPADLDGDGDVDEDDSAFLSESFSGELRSAAGAAPAADLDGNGTVDEGDLMVLEGCMSGPFGSVPVDCIE